MELLILLSREPIDVFVTQWVLKALEPAALTLSLEATARLEHVLQELDQLWRQRVERATLAWSNPSIAW